MLRFDKRPQLPRPIITIEECHANLHKLCLPQSTRWRSDGSRISEKSVRDIQTYLQVLDNRFDRYDDQRWMLRPRIYAILVNINATDLMENFISENLTDFNLPFSEQTRPHFLGELEGKNLSDKFFDIQDYYLTDVKDIESEKSIHLTLSVSGDTYFIPERPLGQGSFGLVTPSLALIYC